MANHFFSNVLLSLLDLQLISYADLQIQFSQYEILTLTGLPDIGLIQETKLPKDLHESSINKVFFTQQLQ